MTGGGLLGDLVAFAIALVLLGFILASDVRPRVKSLLVIGLLLRVVGSQLYYYLSEWLYGFGDYSTYYGTGLRWGQAFWTGTLDQFSSPYVHGWCCTGFMVRLSGLVLLVLGPAINGVFVIFALLGYVGIISLAVAFARSHPDVPLERYLIWIVLFPSLWYWPAALGKDALVLAGVGLSVMGFIGHRGRTGWFPLIVGMALVFAVRPQVAMVVVSSMMLAYWIGSDAAWTPSRIFQGVGLAVGGLALAVVASNALGLHLFSPDEVQSYLDARSATTAYGGSAVDVGGSGVFGILLGIVNVLFRPFPWEARGVAAAIASLEVTSLWVLVIWKWSDVKSFFLQHRESRLLWFGIVFTALYVVLTGMALGNLGLIARQRIHVFPFFLMFLAGGKSVRPRSGPGTYANRGRSRLAPTALMTDATNPAP
ncbi:MAG TPA: hypothetical protein VFL93_10190 [Longimicrobiaceae bacterium]|nr:hypothetical protein [Longimicrobiaceae bacterium]